MGQHSTLCFRKVENKPKSYHYRGVGVYRGYDKVRKGTGMPLPSFLLSAWHRPFAGGPITGVPEKKSKNFPYLQYNCVTK
jgi:hypothetical protein